MIDFDDITETATGIGQICFYADHSTGTPILSVGFCRDGFWTVPVERLEIASMPERRQ